MTRWNVRRWFVQLLRWLGLAKTPTAPTPTPVPSPTPAPTPAPVPVPVFVPLPALHTDGTTFRLPDGTIWKWHGLSAFRMLRQYLAGQDLACYFEAAARYGANVFRVFTRLSWASLKETDYTDEQLLAFVRLLAEKGYRVELVALADCATGAWALDLEAQRAHVARLARVVGGETNVFLELANEPRHSSNAVDVFAFQKPQTVALWSRGSIGDEAPPLPPWDYLTVHCPRKDEWPRTPKNTLEYTRLGYGEVAGLGIPGVDDEPMGVGGQTPHSQRSDVPQDFADFHGVADLFNAGSTLHTQDLGLDGVALTEKAARCAEAVAAAWRAVPADAQLGTYTRGGLSSCPLEHSDATCLRTFATLNGSRATAVRVRGTVAAKARGGWRITGQAGSVVALGR